MTGTSPFCLPVASINFNFWPVVHSTSWKDTLSSQSWASRVSGKEAGVSNNGLIFPNKIQVSFLSLPYPCGWHIKEHIEKEHFSSQTGPKQFLWNGCHFTTNGFSITHNINKIIMQSSCFSSGMIIFSFLLDIKKNHILLLILKHTTHQVFLGNSSSLYIFVPHEIIQQLCLFVHSFVHSFVHTFKRHHLVRIMMWWELYSFLYNSFNSKLLYVSHHPRFQGSKDHRVSAHRGRINKLNKSYSGDLRAE